MSEYSEKKVIKLYNPTNRKSVRFQMVRLKKNEMNIGMINKTIKTTRSGVINHVLYILLFKAASGGEPSLAAANSTGVPASKRGARLRPFRYTLRMKSKT